MSVYRHAPRAVTLVLALGLMGHHQDPQRGVLRGVVRMLDGSGMAGARVVATPVPGGVPTPPGWSAHTGADGTYELPLRPGTHELRVEMAGFCGAGRPKVRIDEGETQEVDFILRLNPVEEVIFVTYPLPEALARADAVVHMRIARSHQARLLIPDVSCGNGNILTEHELEVVTAIKTDERWPNAERVLFAQPRAGTYLQDHTLVRGPETPYAVGEEYVAFLYWSPQQQRWESSAAPNAMIPVRDGRIAWRGSGAHEVHDGMPLAEFLDLLAELRR